MSVYLVCITIFLISPGAVKGYIPESQGETEMGDVEVKASSDQVITRRTSLALITIIYNQDEKIYNNGQPLVPNTSLLNDMKKADLNQEGCGVSFFKKNEKNRQHTSMIIGGEEAIPHSYPWMVRIKITMGRGFGACGGTLINHQWILTAGHCVGNNERHIYEPEDFTLYLGAHSFNNSQTDGETYYAEKVIRHSGYTDTPTNDIALIKLNRRAKYTETIRPICLPTDPNDQLNKKTGVEVIVTGWGKVFEPLDSVSSPVLKEASVKTITSSTFKEIGERYDKFIYLDGKGDNICKGDSGGPMIYYDNDHFVQYGVTSWFINIDERCQSTEPSAFTYLPKFIKWIIKNID